ncbi:MAG: (Fe-S)-binding protein [Chloroflexi bacterium]|nr:(Fe-S)-binding protein [Chloroflexota bacterium]
MHLESVHQTTFLCAQCRKMCRHICSTHSVTRNEADNPTERAILAFGALQRGKFLAEEVDQIYMKCTTCGLCKASCYIDLDVGDIMLAARADIVEQGLAPESAVVLDEKVHQSGNPMGEDPAARFAALHEIIDDLPERAETLYFAGCQTLYRQPEIALSIISVLKALGISFTMLKENEVCCGEPQYLLGFLEGAKDSAKKNVEAILASGARRVVFNCPSCVRIMKNQYRSWGYDLQGQVELLHITEFLAGLIEHGKVSFSQPLPLNVTYHDPCDLGRRQGIFDAPRKILNAIPGVTFTEMQFNRDIAKCCGAGGALEVTNLGLSVDIARQALRPVVETRAEVLVTACPTCKKSFKRLTERLDNLRTTDILELVSTSLGLLPSP